MRANGRLALASALAIALAAPAAAHVTVFVEPGWTQAPACVSTEFVVFVPNERPDATVRVDLMIPPSIRTIGTEPVPGWTTNLTTERGRIARITWSRGHIHPHEYQKFTFLAATPQTSQTISWDAIQTYEGGTVVSWTGPPNSDTPHAQIRITKPLNEGSCRPRRGRP
jgi:uncharacterized protein YcnI